MVSEEVEVHSFTLYSIELTELFFVCMKVKVSNIPGKLLRYTVLNSLTMTILDINNEE